jgi:hypothetical protein
VPGFRRYSGEKAGQTGSGSNRSTPSVLVTGTISLGSFPAVPAKVQRQFPDGVELSVPAQGLPR